MKQTITRVNGKEFYHILTMAGHSRKWKPGKAITINGTKHNQLDVIRHAELSITVERIKQGDKNYLLETADLIEKARDFTLSKDIDLFDYLSDSRQIQAELISRLHDNQLILTRFINLLNEYILERFRRQKYPELPSRLACIYLIDRKNIFKWKKEFKQRDVRRVFRVKTFGEVFKADRYWIKMDVLTAREMIDNAGKYWKGEIAPSPKHRMPEYLFVGKLVVEEEVTNDFLCQQ